MFKNFVRNSCFFNVETKFGSRERERKRERETTDDSIIRSKKISVVCQITRVRVQTPSSYLTFIVLIR